MDKAHLAKWKAELQGMREQIRHSVRGMQRETRSLNPDSPRDAAEQSVTDYSKEFLVEYSEAQRRRLQMIESALRRLEDGTFGVCLACGEDINPKRLSAVPWTQFCMACQEKNERGELSELRRAG